MSPPKNKVHHCRRRRLFYFGGVDTPEGPPPPNPPSSVLTQSKGVPICWFLNSDQNLKLSVAELWGKTWDTVAHSHMTHQAPITGLHNPHCFHFFAILLTISCWHNPGSLEWIAAPLAWLTPRPAPERVCLWLLNISTDPPFTQSAQKGWQSTGLELRILMFKFSWKWPRKNWRLPQLKPHRETPHHNPSPNWTIYIPINRSRRQDFEYIVFYRFDTCRPKVMLPDASWLPAKVAGKAVHHCPL